MREPAGDEPLILRPAGVGGLSAAWDPKLPPGGNARSGSSMELKRFSRFETDVC